MTEYGQIEQLSIAVTEILSRRTLLLAIMRTKSGDDISRDTLKVNLYNLEYMLKKKIGRMNRLVTAEKLQEVKK